MSKLTYSQLEGVWIDAGGQKSLAPMMAAIALAESGGVTTARNDRDNRGTQSSFGLWQISTGTHTPPDPNWSDPIVNARLAIGKLKSQGLTAWGTYSSGAFKPFMANGVPPTAYTGGTPVSSPTGEMGNDQECAWLLHLPVAGDSCVVSKVQLRSLLGVVLLGAGAVVVIAGMAAVLVLALGKKPSGLLKGVTRNVAQPSSNATL